MYFENLFKREENNPVTVCLMGAGEFGASFIIQAPKIPNMAIKAVCTLDPQQALDAFKSAGINQNYIFVAETKEEAHQAYKQGKVLVVKDFSLICNLGIEVLIESSGSPNASAHAAELAIENKMHVIMVSKETESVVGPILCKKAREKGVVYSTGDGDQPSILIGLISWARSLGLKIICAGKSSEYDFVYDPDTGVISCNGQKQSFECKELSNIWNLGDKSAKEIADARAKLVSDKLTLRANPDLCEMVLVSNATNMPLDTPKFHAPIARISELADFFCPKEEGGLLDNIGTLDIFNCLRKPDELSMAGGEFVIVECEDQNIWKVLKAKGHVLSRNGKYASIYIPRHLMGLETGTSVMAAATMGHATGGGNLKPVSDMIGFATRDLPKGYKLAMGGHHHTIDGVGATTGKACALQNDAPIPFYLLSNLTLNKDIKEGHVICLSDVDIPDNSPLLKLRKEQDKAFF